MRSPFSGDYSVIMLGPDPSAHGGIASVAHTLLHEPSLQRFSIRYLPTWVEGGWLRRVSAAMVAVITTACLASTRCVVHVHMASRGSFVRKAAILAVARMRGARVLVHLHGGEFHSFTEQSPALAKCLIRRVFKSADAIVVLSPIWQGRVQQFSGRADAIVLPNPVQIPAATTKMQAPPSVVFLGKLGDQKGVPDLVEAIELLQRRGLTDVRWLLAGGGEVERFRAAISHLPLPARVRIPGWLSRTQVDEALSGGWILCLPSHDEGKPMALIEAMARGLACVATPVGGIPDLIIEGETGRLVPPDSARILADSLESLLRDRDESLRLGKNARRLVEMEYASSRVGVALGRIYDDLLSRADK